MAAAVRRRGGVLRGEVLLEGELLGGCLDVFVELMGTEIWPKPEEWEGKLLLLETSEVDMPDELLRWYLRGLQAQGILSRVKGVVFAVRIARGRWMRTRLTAAST